MRKKSSRILRALAGAALSLLLVAAVSPVARADANVLTDTTNHELYQALAKLYPAKVTGAGFTAAALGSITGSLDLSNQSLLKIDGLQYCTSVTDLKLSGNKGLTELAPFDGESTPEYSFQSIDLSNTGVTALPGSVEMPSLATLDLSDTPITDDGLTGLGGGNVPALTTLKLERCSKLTTINNLAGAYALPNLVTLDLAESSLTDLPADLSGLTSLCNLQLNGKLPSYAGDKIGDPVHLTMMPHITSIGQLPKFKKACSDNVLLNISDTDITNLDSILNGCLGIKYVFWGYMDKSYTPSVFPVVANLFYLDLQYDSGLTAVAVTKTKGIASMPCFTNASNNATLCISGADIHDVSGLASCPGIKTLYWQDMPTLTPDDLTSIEGCTQLTDVDFVNDTGLGGSDHGDTTLSHLQKLTDLTDLGFSSCDMSNLTRLSTMTKLETLSLNDCPITDLNPLTSLTNLWYFHAFDCTLYDISPLSGLSKLTDVNFYGDYLDPTPGSADRQVLDVIANRQNAQVAYQNQQKISVTYTTAQGTLSKSSDSVYYQQSITLPFVLNLPEGMSQASWNVNGDGTTYTPAGQTVPFTWHELPVDSYGDDVTLDAKLTSLDSSIELSALGSTSALSPAFKPTVATYTVALTATTSTVKLTPKVTATGATFTIDGLAVSSKTYSVAGGAAVNAAIVVSNQGKSAIYDVTITRAGAEANTLSDFGYDTGTLNKAFDPYVTTGYTLTIPEASTSVTLTPVLSDPTATLYIDNVKRSSNTYTLTKGQSKTVKIKVAKSGKPSKTYTLVVKCEKSTVCTLNSLAVTNCASALSFDSNTTAYNLTMNENSSSVKVTAGKTETAETVYINGSKATSKTVSIGSGTIKTITILVKAQNTSVTKTYTVTVTRPPHISSFTGSPKEAGVPTVKAGKPLTFIYVLAGAGSVTTIEIQVNGVWTTLMTRTDSSGTKKYVWDGNVTGSMPPAGTYSVRISSTNNGLTSDYKTLTVAVK